MDVDIDVFAELDRLPHALRVLAEAGCEVDVDAALKSAAERGDFRVYLDGMRVDAFVPSLPFYSSAQARIQQAPLEGRPAWFLSPEDLSVFKLLFFRSKDLIDLERLVAARRGSFDRAYVRHWLIELVGETDSRVERWERLVKDVGP